MKAKTIAFMLLAVLLALVATPVYAEDAPSLPHAFYGKVDINGSPAPVGTEVGVRGEGVRTDTDSNPIVTTVEGEYGGSGSFEQKLIVQGDIAEGATVTFYVNGVSTGQTAEWHTGWVTELDIAATISGSPPDDTDESPPDDTDESPPDTTDSTPPGDTDESPPDTTDESPPDTTDSTSGAADEPTSPTPPGPPLPPPPSTGSDGVPVLWLIIGGVVLVGLIIAFWVARSKAY